MRLWSGRRGITARPVVTGPTCKKEPSGASGFGEGGRRVPCHSKWVVVQGAPGGAPSTKDVHRCAIQFAPVSEEGSRRGSCGLNLHRGVGTAGRCGRPQLGDTLRKPSFRTRGRVLRARDPSLAPSLFARSHHPFESRQGGSSNNGHGHTDNFWLVKWYKHIHNVVNCAMIQLLLRDVLHDFNSLCVKN